MKKRIIILVIGVLICAPFILSYWFYGKKTDVEQYLHDSKIIKLEHVEYINASLISLFLYREQYLIQDLGSGKYYILVYFRPTMRKPGLLIENRDKALYVLVNTSDHEKYGTKENPVPVFNYSYERKIDYVISEDDYYSSVRKYLMYFNGYKYESGSVIKKRETIWEITTSAIVILMIVIATPLLYKKIRKNRKI
jgi:hypothetical protein